MLHSCSCWTRAQKIDPLLLSFHRHHHTLESKFILTSLFLFYRRASQGQLGQVHRHKERGWFLAHSTTVPDHVDGMARAVVAIIGLRLGRVKISIYFFSPVVFTVTRHPFFHLMSLWSGLSSFSLDGFYWEPPTAVGMWHLFNSLGTF